MPSIWWTREATTQYTKYRGDLAVQQTLSDLVGLVEERPRAGWSIADLLDDRDTYAARLRQALRGMAFPEPVRLVVAVVPRPQGAMPPPLLAVVAHMPGAPPGTGCEHSVVTMGLVHRRPGSPMR